MRMKTDSVQIPMRVLCSVETLDELHDWLAAQKPDVMAELRAARREDRAGKFKVWKPRHLPGSEAQFKSPDWHAEVLKERAERVKNGTESFVDWDTAKKQLRDRLK